MLLVRTADACVLWTGGGLEGQRPLAMQICAKEQLLAITADGRVHGWDQDGTYTLRADLAAYAPPGATLTAAAVAPVRRI